MDSNKFVRLVIITLVVIVAYIGLALTHPAQRQLAEQAGTDIAASANMSNQPGAKEFVDAWPTLVWFIPGIIGGVLVVITLLKREEPKY